MRDFGYFVAFLAAALLVAAATLFPVQLGVSALTDLEPHKTLPRLGKLLAAAALIPFLMRLDLWDRRLLGYGIPRRRFLAAVAGGWLAGTAILLVLLALLVVLGVRELQAPELGPWDLARLTLKALGAGLAVAFIEETFFRGAMFAGMRRHVSLWRAALLTALLYAALHFIRPQPLGPDEAVGWATGLGLLAGAFDPFGGAGIWDSFAALVAAGVFLALLRAWHGSIAVAIGVHAGWVMMIKLGKIFTDDVPGSPLAYLTGTYDGVIGWLAAAWLSVLVIAIARPAAAADQARHQDRD